MSPTSCTSINVSTLSKLSILNSVGLFQLVVGTKASSESPSPKKIYALNPFKTKSTVHSQSTSNRSIESIFIIKPSDENWCAGIFLLQITFVISSKITDSRTKVERNSLSISLIPILIDLNTSLGNEKLFMVLTSAF